jgi:acetyl/propionyl-CoA carboxylase alpha subunit
MEMNTRLQVEHPVTEAVTGLDLVELQLEIAAGKRLALEPRLTGHAIEVRLYAENPERRFLPSTGRLVRFRIPPTVRVDSGVREGDEVSVHYDPMLAKLIAHGPSRDAARSALLDALGASRVAGVEHNIGYLRALLGHPAFIAGDYTTHLAEQYHDELAALPDDALWGAAALVARAALSGPPGPWADDRGWRLNRPPRTTVHLRRGKVRRSVVIGADHIDCGVPERAPQPFTARFLAGDELEFGCGDARLRIGYAWQGERLYLMHDGRSVAFEPLTDVAAVEASDVAAAGRIEAPMPGQIVRLAVAPGDRVERGQVLVILEAMKMEHTVAAPRSGVVREVRCTAGQRVEEHTELIVLEAPGGT